VNVPKQLDNELQKELEKFRINHFGTRGPLRAKNKIILFFKAFAQFFIINDYVATEKAPVD